ncbi:aldehyde dehydrogenase (NADP(+)) [Robiginitalea sediminis]|uniref:aldehyde dehydrogenase (NADP(+)) n=1 Tax=Robiginitalea sediminis TaxID=1982593 RepID=UPI000B4A6130|nr:aldehyde dehydrogenase (NADP(+)) [Robiginitalea sediminis]
MQYPISGGQIIGFSESRSGSQTFQSTNPATGSLNEWHFLEATPQEADRAMQMARQAFRVYRQKPGPARAAFLRRIAELLEEGAEALVPLYVAESGLPEGRARGELGRTTGQLRKFADQAEDGSWMAATIDTADLARQPIPKPDLRKCLAPLGPVVVFGASNFPLAFSTAGGDTASAFAAGCPVVVKGHPLHPATGEWVARAIQQAAEQTGMPEGVFSHLQGTTHSLGASLVQHPATAAVGFTGSRAGGLALAALGQGRQVPIPVFAEMGSINPVLLLPEALSAGDKWAAAYAQSVTLGTGQFCTNPGLLIGLEGEALEGFRETLAREMNQIPQACMLGEGIAARYIRMQETLLQENGVRRIGAPAAAPGVNCVPPTVAAVSGSDFKASPTLQEEVFGPFTLVVGCRDEGEMLQVLESLEGQLTGTVLASEAECGQYRVHIAALESRVGRILFNGVPTGVEVGPAMHHGGPFPATTDSRFTSVGADAIYRWARPVSYQNAPQELLPEALRDANLLGIWRTIDGVPTRESIHNE